MKQRLRKLLALLIVLFADDVAYAQTNITVTSLAQLKSLSGLSNVTVTMAPGEYWIDGDRPDAAYLNFSGSNTVFDFTNAVFKIDTRDIAGYRDPVTNANADFDIVRLSGDGVTVQGLTLIGEDVDLDNDPDARRFPNRGASYVQVSGVNNSLLDASVSTRGSNPYGLGEAFGKGGRQFPQGEPPGQVEGEEEGVVGLPWIGHNKVSGIHVWEASNPTVANLDLSMQTYGHGLFIQKSSDIYIRDSEITGELFPASNVENHPLYIEYGNITSQGVSIPAGIEYSGQEDGIRAYGSIDGVPVTNITVENTVVTNMRNAYSTALAGGTTNLTNVEAYSSELGFAVNGNTTISGGKGDIVNGPLLWYYNDGSDNDIELELVGGQPVGVDYSVAYVAGYDSSFTLTSDASADLLPEDSVIRLGQVYFENWRDSDAPSGPEDGNAQPMSNSRFTNNTNRMVVIGESATGNVGSSLGPVISNGKENYYDGVTLVQSGTRLELIHEQGLGNSGKETGAELVRGGIAYTGTVTAATMDDNGTVVEAGGTLELSPGLSIVDEKLTISGNGVDSKGALYSDGQASNGTRFGDTSAGNESTIFVDGSASIGVGIAGNQLLVGAIQGTGDLTKSGLGRLSIEKSSTLSGTLFVDEGTLSAPTNVVLGDITVSTGGTLAPGNSAGSLTTGNLDLLTGSTLEIEVGGLLAGSEYDQLLADSVTLGGELSISLLDSGGGTFIPDFSDTFTLLAATALTGAFDNVANGERVSTIGLEGSFLVSYDSLTAEVLLSDFLASLLGDLDGNGRVDGADWTLFKAGSNIDLSEFTAEAAYQHGDLNGDFQHNLADFSMFQASYNAIHGTGAFAKLLSVPEPTAIALAVICIVGVSVVRG